MDDPGIPDVTCVKNPAVVCQKRHCVPGAAAGECGDVDSGGSKMNWDRGFKRIGLVLSSVGAVVGAGLSFCDSLEVLNWNKSILARERQAKYSEMDRSALMDKWAEATTDTEQNELWLRWTGALLEQRAEGKPIPSTHRFPPRWRTANGELLPLTPEEVSQIQNRQWQIQHQERIKDLERTVWDNQMDLMITPVFGAGLGFAFAFALYAATRWGAWPLLIWIRRGFREDELKDEQQTNKSGPA